MAQWLSIDGDPLIRDWPDEYLCMMYNLFRFSPDTALKTLQKSPQNRQEGE